MKVRHAIGASLGGVVLTLSVAVPAYAASESGYKSCSGIGSHTVVSRGYANGAQTHYQNGSSYAWGSSGASYVVRNVNFGYTTANWTVATTGSLNAAGTYAYCPE